MSPSDGTHEIWWDAALTAALFAIDPFSLGGVVLCDQPGPVRDRWLSLAKSYLADGRPLLRVPLHTGPDRLLGGLNLSATLSAGRPIKESGLLASADGGVLILAMAERLSAQTAAILASVLDRGDVRVQRVTQSDNWDGTDDPLELSEASYDKGDALRAELESFVTAIREDRPVVVSGHDGQRVLELAETILERMSAAAAR